MGAAVDAAAGSTEDFPRTGDLIALLFYPAACCAAALFARGRTSGVQAGLVLDAAIAALAAIALGAALAHVGGFEAVEAAYVAGDLVVLAAVVISFALSGWQPGRAWLAAGAGLAVATLGDLPHVYGAGTGFQSDGALAVAWPAAALLVGFGALTRVDPYERPRTVYWRILLVPASFAVVAIALLVADRVEPLGPVAVTFAALALIATAARPVLGFRENVRVLARGRQDSVADPLTGLWNRRKLMTDLREQTRSSDGASRILILFDLDGFKQYNDTFGHPAGDALLARLGANLQKAVGPYGGVYRMGGDEFCALLEVGMASARTLTSIAAAALSERGEAFSIKSSYGAVMLPQEARDATSALKIADQRMYAQKEKRRPSPGRQTRDILVQVLRERDPELGDHMSAVGELSRRVGQRLKLLPEELDETVRASELHDIGKMAIPDAILHKPGPLEEKEWEFVHKHTVIGERILSAAPALTPVAKIVRSSHERWDGGGYPDGLSGDAIPIGARILAACDSFHAMTTARPYGVTLSIDEALGEMRRAAGSEFDPRVVDTLIDVVTDAQAVSAPPSPEAAPPA
jgi:diguanylate cyclase (GGDEF)-like protein